MAGLVPFGRRGISRYNPLEDFGMSDLMRGFFGADSTFRVDVKDRDDHYEIDAELPGLHREMIDVSVKDGYLTIRANKEEETKTEKDDYVLNERKMGSVSRSFAIGNVKEDEITAEYKDGVLKVTLPKGDEPEDKTRKIDIQ